MHLNPRSELRLRVVVLGLSLMVLPHLLSAGEPKSWSLASPGRQCEVIVTLGENGNLSYQVLHQGKTVLHQSPLGLRLDNQSFESGLSFERAGETESRREKYELFAGTAPRVDHLLTRRTLVFRNSKNVAMETDLAASDEGVAFRYRFLGKSGDVRVVQSERTGFALPPNARGW